MTQFDQTDADYGICVDCGIALATAESAKTHRSETMIPGRSSHATRATNPTRNERIQLWVDGVVEDAIADAIEELRREWSRATVTWAEIEEALSWHSEFGEAWDDEK